MIRDARCFKMFWLWSDARLRRRTLFALLLIGASSIASAKEPFYTLEPRPQTVPLPESTADSAGNAAADGHPADNDVLRAPADLRPKVFVHTVKRGCKPCETFAEWWLNNCDTFPLNVEPVEYESFDALPHWVLERGVPLAHFESERTETGWEARTWDPARVLGHWNDANPVRAKATAPPLYVGAAMLDQIAKYLPNGTRITIDLPRPMTVSLDDKTQLSYSKVTGQLVTANGKSVLKLDAPRPTIAAWRGVWKIGTTFGAQLEELIFWETQPPSVGVQTNRGMYKFTMEPVK